MASDEVVVQDAIRTLLTRKWKKYAQKFFLLQLAVYLGLLVCLIFFFEVENNGIMYVLGSICIILNSIFLAYEVFQVIIQRLSYFKDFWNWIDFIRIALVYFCIITERSENYKVGEETLAIMFLFVWFKVFKYLQVFEPLRYLIKMIFECVKCLRTFMMILLTALFAYA